MSRGRRRDTKEWAEIIEGQEGSGQTPKEFCQSRSIGLASFYQWRRRFKNGETLSGNNASSSGSFIDVGQFGTTASSSSPGMSPWTVTLDLGEGFKLTLQRG